MYVKIYLALKRDTTCIIKAEFMFTQCLNEPREFINATLALIHDELWCSVSFGV